jgi:hypothetical protein
LHPRDLSVNIVASPAIVLDRVELEPFGVFATTETVKDAGLS